jgi:hypothetical protein
LICRVGADRQPGRACYVGFLGQRDEDMKPSQINEPCSYTVQERFLDALEIMGF